MENAAQKSKITSYFESLQQGVADNRGKQGRVHELAYVLCGVLLAVLLGKKRLSQIHRYMKNKHEYLIKVTGYEAERAVSDAQLRRILRTVDYESYNKVNREFFGKEIRHRAATEWYSIDGKELRGSLQVDDNGHKDYRGEVVVNAVGHQTNSVVAQTYYRGDKESEKLAVRQLLQQSGLKQESTTMDALHCDPNTTSLIEQASGRYIVQVKGNQAELLEELQQIPRFTSLSSSHQSLDKAHGRLEKRQGKFYSIEHEYFDPRWHKSGLRTVGIIYRHTTILKTGQVRQETSYYVSNQSIVQQSQRVGEELFKAIRRHWAVEADNYVRDVTMNEDQFKTPKGRLSRTMATARTLAINLLRKAGAVNLQAQMERFADVEGVLEEFLKKIHFST